MQDSATNIVVKTLPPSTQRLPLFIVGDVHGCAYELSELIESAKKHLPAFQLVLVGDLFTKGPDPVGVYELILEHNAICLKGNHDWALLSILNQIQKKNYQPLSNHSRQTLHLIRYHKRGIYDLLVSLPHAYRTVIVSPLTRPSWEKEYPLIIVHAGIDPTQSLEGTTERMLLTARYVRWDLKGSERKLTLVPSSYRVETPNPIPYVSTDSSGLGTEREKFRWHDLHQGPELIVFGHDAKQGLFRKTLPSGRPICVGVDTGCTYGNSLTGYFPEIDLAIQVHAQRKYFDVKKNQIILKPHPLRQSVS